MSYKSENSLLKNKFDFTYKTEKVIEFMLFILTLIVKKKKN